MFNAKNKSIMKFINVKIVTVGDVRSGISTTTGKPWASRTVLLRFEDETGESYISAAVDNEVWKQLGYSEGQSATLSLKFRTKRFLNGFVSNDIRIVVAPPTAQ